MNKKAARIGVFCGSLLGTTIFVYAITSLFFTNSVTSILSKKVVFQFELTTDMTATEVGPGDSFDVKPAVYNDATEEMYVFIQVDMPTLVDGDLYSFDVNEEWIPVESRNGTVVYAYGSTDMTVVSPGENTCELTSQMTMQSISNEEFAAIDDINIMVTGYAIGIEDVSTNPVVAWKECKEIGNFQ